MTVRYLDVKDPTVSRIIRAAFPSWKGRRVSVEVGPQDSPREYSQYWDSGSKDCWAAVDVETGRAQHAPDNHPMFNAAAPRALPVLPPSGVYVRWSRYGSESSITIYARPELVSRFALPEPVALTWSERVVLTATRSLKACYGGRTRQGEAERETGIAAADYEAARAALIGRKLLNAAGAITDAGRNALESAGHADLYALGKARPGAAPAAPAFLSEHVPGVPQ